MDGDDLITKTALEEFYTLAEEYQADVVRTNQFFTLWRGEEKSVDDPAFIDFKELTNPANFSETLYTAVRPDKPVFDTTDLGERVKNFVEGGVYAGYPYTSFCRRDFLVNNQIIFPNVFVHEDQIFTFHVVCLAEKILFVPNINYIVRPRKGSVMREQLDLDKKIHRSLRIFIDGFNALKKIMDDINFFGEHPDYRYAVLNWYVQSKPYHLLETYAQVHPAVLNPLVEKEFSGDNAAFSAYLFNSTIIQRIQIMQLYQELSKFQQQ